MSAVTAGDGQLRSEKHSDIFNQYWSSVFVCEETHQDEFCRPEFINVLTRGVGMDTCRPSELIPVTRPPWRSVGLLDCRLG